jgi:hypothetical protein
VNWTDISDKVSFPKAATHGTVFVISGKSFEKMKKAQLK